jgi:hypothetical protein
MAAQIDRDNFPRRGKVGYLLAPDLVSRPHTMDEDQRGLSTSFDLAKKPGAVARNEHAETFPQKTLRETIPT